MRKLTTEQFISNATEAHSDHYDYSEVVYVGNKVKVTIICPEHGRFMQAPVEHAKGSGCSICSHKKAGNNRRIRKEEFIRRAQEIHGKKYDYSLVSIETLTTKIKIICPEHGVFEQSASGHVAGKGCRQCAIADNTRLSLDEFIHRAQKVHGERYEYSAAVYVGINIKVTIFCPDHGKFEQLPSNHLQGGGCPTCAIKKRSVNRRLSHSEFLNRASEVHGNKYDYSYTKIENSKTSVQIVCPAHGTFEQTPANHLTGYGCKLCGFENAGQYHKKNTGSFIEEACRIHGKAYDYSKTIYRGAREKVSIICSKHGAFEQTASVHLRCKPGEACLACSYENRGTRNQTEFDEFLKQAVGVHGDTYDYSRARTLYRGTAKNIEILCRTHGMFKQTPVNHLRGEGCRKCSRLKLADTFRKSSADFIADALKVHGDRYDYSQADYRGAFESVTIICPVDGPFNQSPTSHLSGIGCPKCSRRAQGAPRNLKRALRGEFDDGKPSYVYVVEFRLPGIEMELVKVGSGTGTRLGTTLNSIKRVGGFVLKTHKSEFQSSGEAIVFEQIAHQQILEYQFVVPPELKFAGHSEVFTQVPDFFVIDQNETLLRFRAGERWAIKRVAKRRYE